MSYKNIDYRKSTPGYLRTFIGRVVLWQLKLQKYVALSITNDKYIALTE